MYAKSAYSPSADTINPGSTSWRTRAFQDSGRRGLRTRGLLEARCRLPRRLGLLAAAFLAFMGGSGHDAWGPARQALTHRLTTSVIVTTFLIRGGVPDGNAREQGSAKVALTEAGTFLQLHPLKAYKEAGCIAQMLVYWRGMRVGELYDQYAAGQGSRD